MSAHPLRQSDCGLSVVYLPSVCGKCQVLAVNIV